MRARDDGKRAVLVCGGRHYKDSVLVFRSLDILHAEKRIDLIVHGDCRGADRLAEDWAIARGISSVRYPADWANEGRLTAGPIRNQRMLDMERPSMVVAFEGTKGTVDMVRRAKAAGVEVVRVVPFKPRKPARESWRKFRARKEAAERLAAQQAAEGVKDSPSNG